MATYVNGEQLSRQWVARERTLLAERYLRAGRDLDDAMLDAEAHANGVEKLLLRQRAREAVPTVSRRDVQRKLDRRAEEFGGIGAYYRHLGLDPSDADLARDELREEIRYDRYIAILCKDVPPPDDAELQVYYQENPEKFQSPEGVHLAHVTMQPDPALGHMEIVTLLMNLRESLAKDPDMRGVKHRMFGEGISGGDLGFVPRGELGEAFDKVIFDLEPMTVSDVFQSPQGYHLAIVYQHLPAKTLSLDDMRTTLRDFLWRERKNEHVGARVDDFLKESVIEEREDG